jgi:hypothetical protein
MRPPEQARWNPRPGDVALELLKALVSKIDAVHQDPQYEAVWIYNQIRRGTYTGLKYADELDAARAALARLEGK